MARIWSRCFDKREHRLIRPALDSRYRIMTDCWAENPSDRPTFSKLKQQMTEMEKDHHVGHVTIIENKR